MKLVLFATLAQACVAFRGPHGFKASGIAPRKSETHMSNSGAPTRREAVLSVAAVGGAVFLAGEDAFAADYKLTKEYATDVENLLANMRYATNLTRGTPGFEETVENTRKEMSDFVSYYRRQQRYAGAQSFNTLYTAVNTLSGHYASFGNSYPVPAKRRERLTVQYREVRMS